mmetsp:Transcript_16429/g.33425  ORF Transcript_16429/g.33425 Transcript_16429/m.33425 type:complete len:247 (-) Transcript_16429:32-772(-)
MNSAFSRLSIAPKVSTWTSCISLAASSTSPLASLIPASSLTRRALSTSTKIFPSVTASRVPINRSFSSSLPVSSSHFIAIWTMSMIALFSCPLFFGSSWRYSCTSGHLPFSLNIFRTWHESLEAEDPSEACRAFFSTMRQASTASSTRPAAASSDALAIVSAASLEKSSCAFGSFVRESVSWREEICSAILPSCLLLLGLYKFGKRLLHSRYTVTGQGGGGGNQVHSKTNETYLENNGSLTPGCAS